MSKFSDDKLDLKQIDDIVNEEFEKETKCETDEKEEHVFSREYNEKKNCILNSVEGKTRKGIFVRYKYAKVMVPAAGLLIAFTTTAYATNGFKSFSFNEKKTGKYKVDVVIEKGDDVGEKGELIGGVSGDGDMTFDTPNGQVNYYEILDCELINGLQIPDQDRYLKVNIGYLPENTEEDNGLLVNKYHANAGEFDIGIYDMRDINNSINLENFKVTSVNKININGHKAILTEADNILFDLLKEEYMSGGGFTKNMYIYFEEYDAMVHIWASSNLDSNEIIKIAENISLTKGDRYDCMYFGDWQMFNVVVPGSKDNVEDPYHLYEISADKVHMYNIGESFYSEADTLSQGIGGIDFQYKVNDVQVVDNLREIKNYDTSKMIEKIENDEDYSKFIDDNGNLIQDRLLYVKEGDGIYTLDKVVDDKKVDLKFVFAEIEVSNNSEYDIDDTIILTDITRVREENGIVKLINENGYDLEKPEENYDYIYNSANMLTKHSELYNDIFTDNKNHIQLKSGETKTMHVLFCMDENDLKMACLNTSIYGEGTISFSKDTNMANYVKLVN